MSKELTKEVMAAIKQLGRKDRAKITKVIFAKRDKQKYLERKEIAKTERDDP